MDINGEVHRLVEVQGRPVHLDRTPGMHTWMSGAATWRFARCVPTNRDDANSSGALRECARLQVEVFSVDTRHSDYLSCSLLRLVLASAAPQKEGLHSFGLSDLRPSLPSGSPACLHCTNWRPGSHRMCARALIWIMQAHSTGWRDPAMLLSAFMMPFYYGSRARGSRYLKLRSTRRPTLTRQLRGDDHLLFGRFDVRLGKLRNVLVGTPHLGADGCRICWSTPPWAADEAIYTRSPILPHRAGLRPTGHPAGDEGGGWSGIQQNLDPKWPTPGSTWETRG